MCTFARLCIYIYSTIVDVYSRPYVRSSICTVVRIYGRLPEQHERNKGKGCKDPERAETGSGVWKSAKNLRVLGFPSSKGYDDRTLKLIDAFGGRSRRACMAPGSESNVSRSQASLHMNVAL